MASPLQRLKSPWVLLVLAAALAGLVAYIAYVYLQQREQSIKDEVAARTTRNQTPKVSVVVPREDARVGSVVDPAMFVSRQIDQDLVYPDTVTAGDFSEVRGQRLARPVLRGRPLRITDLQTPEVTDVASVLPAGTRAVTIEIDSVNSIAQTLRPGHRVDVFLLSKADQPRDSEVTEQALNQVTLFMQNLSVLATGQEFADIASGDAERTSKMVPPGAVEGARDKGFDTITLLVSPSEAARLLVGQKMGSFRVALRGTKDESAVALRALTGGDVMPPSGKPRAGGIEFIVGGKNGGNAALTPTLLPMGVLSLARGAAAALPAAAAPDAAARPAEVKETVEQVLRDLSTPSRRAGAAGGAAIPAADPAVR